MNNTGKTKLIFDIGMHKGEDTTYYLHRGYHVIGVDADPTLIGQTKERLAPFIKSGQLRLLNFAISNKEEIINFHISKHSIWNSLNKRISDREESLIKTIKVSSIKLSELIKEYGVPFYCKIDIEGYDAIALESLKECENLPLYISVESECLGDKEKISDKEALETLNKLKELGYKKFKLVDQRSLIPLSKTKIFYGKNFGLMRKLTGKVTKRLLGSISNKPFSRQRIEKQRERLHLKYNHVFPKGASGPFGEDISGKWYSFLEAKEMLLKHRKDYYNTEVAICYGFWCDWHAKF